MRSERLWDERNARFNSRHEVHSSCENREEEEDSRLNDRNLSQLPRDTTGRARALLSAVKATPVLSHGTTPLMVQLFREPCDLTAKPP